MQVIDIIVSRESGNSVWAKVVFLGDRGESVSVRLPCPVPTGGPIGRNRIVKRAASLLHGMVASETFDSLGEQGWPVPAGRFGATSETPLLPREEQWRGGSAPGEE